MGPQAGLVGENSAAVLVIVVEENSAVVIVVGENAAVVIVVEENSEVVIFSGFLRFLLFLWLL